MSKVIEIDNIKTKIQLSFEKASVQFPKQLNEKSINKKSNVEFLLCCQNWILSAN